MDKKTSRYEEQPTASDPRADGVNGNKGYKVVFESMSQEKKDLKIEVRR